MKDCHSAMGNWISRMVDVLSNPVFKLTTSGRTDILRLILVSKAFQVETLLSTEWKANQSEIPALAYSHATANCFQKWCGSTKMHVVTWVRICSLYDQVVHPKRGAQTFREVPILMLVSLSVL